MSFSKISWGKSLAYALIVFTVGGILLHTSYRHYAKEIPQEKLDLFFANFIKQPAVEIDVANRPFIGNKDAKIVVVEFSDFECPYCKKAAQTLKPILAQYKKQVKFVFMNYPLDRNCNETMERSLHQRACATAYAAYCAGQQGKFWEYHDKAFARQPKFHQASLENIAEKLNLDQQAFKSCMEADSTKAAIVSDLKQGRKAKVRGTPSVYVNGVRFAPWMSRKAWQQVIDKLSAQN